MKKNKNIEENLKKSLKKFSNQKNTTKTREKIEESIASTLDQLNHVDLDIKVSVEKDAKDPSACVIHLKFPDEKKKVKK